jgi:transketolase
VKNTNNIIQLCRQQAMQQPLNQRSKDIRVKTIKLSKANGGYHLGGSFSAVEILLSILDTPREGDRFIMSKGHGCWPLYVMLQERGLNPLLEGHPKLDPANGINFTTGSEGHGMPAALGMALARKIMHRPGKIIALIGDGECQEGTTWESLLIGAKQQLNNVVIVTDFNGIQGSGYVRDILPVDAIGECASAIGWEAVHVNGHNLNDLEQAVHGGEQNAPRLVIAHTIKGKGVSYMEDKPEWHAKWVDDEHERIAANDLK